MITKFEDFINEEIKIPGKDMDIKDLASIASRLGYEYEDFLQLLNDQLESSGYDGVQDFFNDITKKSPEIEYVGKGIFNIVSNIKSKVYNRYSRYGNDA